MPDESFERTVKQYIASGAAEGAVAAARRLSEALGVGLNEVLDAVQSFGSWESGATLVAQTSVTVGGPAARVAVGGFAGVVTATGTVNGSPGPGSPTVIRQHDVDEVTTQAFRGGLARLSANQRVLIAVILIAAIFLMLPPHIQAEVVTEAALAAAVAAVLVLIKRS